MIKGAELLVRALENEGVRYIFGIPGEENLDVVEALRTSSIQLILTRHEQAAAFMAATHGRLTGKAGVCLSTLGPGALNFSTGAAYALLGGMPLVMITGQKSILSSPQAGFQLVDTVATMTPLTKLSQQIHSPSVIPYMVREAFRVAEVEVPGPVHLELPEDIARQKTPNVALVPPLPPLYPVASDDVLENAAELIKKAKRPLVMLGAGASRPHLSEALSAFILRSKLPFFTTQMGKGSVAGASDYYMGTTALSEGDAVHEVIHASDLIITIGHSTVEKPPFIMKDSKPKVLHINYLPAHIVQVYYPQAQVIGCLPTSLTQLADKIEGQLPNSETLLTFREKILKRTHYPIKDPSFVPPYIISQIREVMPKDGIVTLDNGLYKIWFARRYRTQVANTLLLDNALATMGAGLPSAIMASILYPERRVMTVAGDGGFMMNSQELETAQRLKLNLVVLILEDHAYGMIRWKQALDHFTDFGMTFQNPDFVKYAESYGAFGKRITSPESLKPAIDDAFRKGGVHVIVTPIDYSDTSF